MVSFFRPQIFTLSLIAFTLLSNSLAAPATTKNKVKITAEGNDDWLAKQYQISIQGVKKSFLDNGGVIASPSKQDPNYFFVWIRDASLTVDALAELYVETGDKEIGNLINKYVDFTKKVQFAPTPSNSLGEPKFNVDGTAFTGPWARPQNDGPASRAFALIRYAKSCFQRKECKLDTFYVKDLAANSPVKTDLEFVAHHWKDSSADLWEETFGNHFYTRLVQRRALLDGAELAKSQNDNEAAKYYQDQATEIEKGMDAFWDNGKKYLVVTLNQNGGLDYKTSGLDTAILLASLHADRGDGFYGPSSDKILATLYAATQMFKPIYNINKNNEDLGVAVGRYPEDKYDGNGTSEGNPWMLTTAAMAEILYKTKINWSKAGKFQVTEFNAPFLNFIAKGQAEYKSGTTVSKQDKLFAQTLSFLQASGDSFLARVRLHTGEPGGLNEQWNRGTGVQQGARELTWSFVSFVTAYKARTQALKL